KNDGYRAHAQHGDWILADPRDPGRSDRTYPAAGGRYRLVDPGLGRAIELQVEGGRSAVVWNPGAQAAAKMADVGPHWRQFLCVEAANAGPDLVALAPGQAHALVQAIAVQPLWPGPAACVPAWLSAPIAARPRGVCPIMRACLQPATPRESNRFQPAHGRAGLHLRHRADRRAVVRRDHPGAA